MLHSIKNIRKARGHSKTTCSSLKADTLLIKEYTKIIKKDRLTLQKLTKSIKED